MSSNLNTIYAQPGQRVLLADLGIAIYGGTNDDGQPYVAINTDDIAVAHRYDEATGILGTAQPYTYEQDGACAVVKGPTGEVVARHFPQPDSASARLAARRHYLALNAEWPQECGMPDVEVLMGDAVLYDSEDHNPALRERSPVAGREAEQA